MSSRSEADFRGSRLPSTPTVTLPWCPTAGVQAVPPSGMRLISKNPAYEPVEVPMADVDVVGRVVWKGGRL